jgi:hypothetical protein
MTGLSWELAGCMFVFQVLQAIMVGAVLALLLWHEKKVNAHRMHVNGDMRTSGGIRP